MVARLSSVITLDELNADCAWSRSLPSIVSWPVRVGRRRGMVGTIGCELGTTAAGGQKRLC